MSRLERYIVILPKSTHISRTFETFSAAEGWMHATCSSGYVAIILAEVVNKIETTDIQTKVIDFAKQFDGKFDL